MKQRLEPLFPRDPCGRIALGLASLSFGPLCWIMAIGLTLRPRSADVLEFLFLAAAAEFSGALALFFACGLIWALATPRWLEGVLDYVVKKIAVAFGVFAVPFAGLAIWALAVA